MIPTRAALLGGEKVRLYHNVASYGPTSGRLLVELTVRPSARLAWEFEVLGDVAGALPVPLAPIKHPLAGRWFSLVEPTAYAITHDAPGPRASIRGRAAMAVFGSLEDEAEAYEFYLPNGRFQQATRNQECGDRFLPELPAGTDPVWVGDGHHVRVDLDDEWGLVLDTSQAALDWLKPAAENVGTRVTTVGRLYRLPPPRHRDLDPARRPPLRLSAALDRLFALADLLSFANAGRTGPLFVVGQGHDPEPPYFPVKCAAGLAFPAVPVEQLGSSWIARDTDVAAYLRCLPALERMLATPHWRAAFDVALVWYSLASRPVAWPVTANAVGAALERLSYAVLVEDEPDPDRRAEYEALFERPGRKTPGARREAPAVVKGSGGLAAHRTRLLLDRVGLGPDRGHDDANDAKAFLEVRNNATHPVASNLPGPDEVSRLLRRALGWVEETLLWRVGYAGSYVDRGTQWVASIQHRYDLSRRNPNW